MTVLPIDQLPRFDGEVDNTLEVPGKRAPLVLGNKNFADVTDTVTSITLHKTPRAWYVAFVLALGRHVLILGRTARRFQAEVSPIAEEIAREGARASEHADRLGRTRRTGRS